MKWWGIFTIAVLALTSCGSERKMGSYKGREVRLVNDEPDYKKDRRLEEYTKNSTNSHGIMGPGSGGSYSAYSYRQSAIKAKKDTTQVPVIEQDLTQEEMEGITADTTDTEVSW